MERQGPHYLLFCSGFDAEIYNSEINKGKVDIMLKTIELKL